MRERLKTKEFHNTKKKKDEYRILALDQASRITGFAIFDNNELIEYGKMDLSKESESDLGYKLWTLRGLVKNLIEQRGI